MAMGTVLSPVRDVFRAFVATAVPEAARLDVAAWDELESLVEGQLRDRPAAMQRQLRLLLRVIEWLPVFRHGRRFSALGPSARERVLAWLQDNPSELIRTGFWGVRTLAFLGYYGRADAVRDIGYRADPRGWEALR